MQKRFNGKVALVTGAAVGIGRAAARRFADEGAKVVLFDVNADALAKVNREIEAAGGSAIAFTVDVSDEEAVNAAVRAAEEKYGKIDILVNNAAIWRVNSAFLDTPSSTWKKLFEINLFGTVYCTRAAARGMAERGYGRIVNVASVAGIYGNCNMSPYSATKGAMISLTKSLAKELSGKGIRVNAVSPGTVSSSEDPDPDSFAENPMSYYGRSGTDNENADLILFLASDEAGYLSGQNIAIDGVRRML